jgi:signal transduction histidine kinase
VELTESNRELQLGLARHDTLNRSLDNKGKKSEALLKESRHLEKQLQQMTQQVLIVNEDGRKKMSLRLQDEIVQTLEGIHLRLLVLSNEVAVGSVDFEKDIAITQGLVRQSIQAINTFAHECGIPYEN